MDKTKVKNNLYFCYILLLAVSAVFFIFRLTSYQARTLIQLDEIVYFIVSFLIFVGLFAGLIAFDKKKNKFTWLRFWVLFCMFIFGLCITILGSQFLSGDYTAFLRVWSDKYREGSFSDALNSIVTVSDYTPLYNYFLVIFARIGLNSLYSIKVLTLLFSILLAFVMEKIIDLILKSDFSSIRFFSFLILPEILIEYAFWGQCDVIYTSFALLAFYFALKKNSKLSFMFIGLSFATKMQFLFAVPILFIMLLVKDEDGKNYLKWKDIWIAPLMYLVNLIPAITGTKVTDLLLVYFKQTSTNYGLSGNCANICNFFRLIIGTTNTTLIKVITYFQIVLTLSVLAFVVVLIIKLSKKRTIFHKELVLFATIFSFLMVFFMPKMLERFYFIPAMFSVILAFVYKERIYQILAMLINSGLYFMMLIFICNAHEFMFLITYVSIIGMVSAFVALGIIIKILVDYSKIVFTKSENCGRQ